MPCRDMLRCVVRGTTQRVFRMWEQIRAVWRSSSIFIVGLAVIFGAIFLGGYLSSSRSPTPAASLGQAASSDQTRDRGKPVVASTGTTSPQGGSAKQPSQQAAQSSKAPSQPPAHQNNPTPAPTANAA